MAERRFMTAEWRAVLGVTYHTDEALLEHHLPHGSVRADLQRAVPHDPHEGRADRTNDLQRPSGSVSAGRPSGDACADRGPRPRVRPG
jgi:hypothetical protein